MKTDDVNIARGLGRGVEITEEIRNKKSANNLFANIFEGNPSLNELDWPEQSCEQIEKRDEIVKKLTEFLIKDVDQYSIDNNACVPMEVFKSMAGMGLYGLKVPEKWGGKGLTHTSFIETLSIANSWCSAIAIVVSADNSIGCKFPLMYYGTKKQKDRLLPELVKWPTVFCLTEKEVGSDASKVRTYALRIRDAQGVVCGYQLTGEKWYATNPILEDGQPLAKYAAVVARIVDDPSELNNKHTEECYGLFIVPTDSPGIDIGVKNTFIGMRGIHNSNLKLDEVYVPEHNLIGREGSGLKIAFESLNTGRIAIAKGCLGIAKQALHIMRWWAKKREQLGGPLEDKELVRNKLLRGAADILAMEAMVKYSSLAFDDGKDVRIEAAASKLFCSEKTWQIVDDMMQIRGARGYETWQSLSKHELTPPDEALWASARPNRIFEGANDIMVQFIFREGTDKYVKTAKPLMSNKASLWKKSWSILNIVGYYIETLHSGESFHADHKIIPHLAFIESSSRKLVRKTITKLGKHQNDLVTRQLHIDRFARIAVNLGAMALTCSYVYKNKDPDYVELADLFCRTATKEVNASFVALDKNDDKYEWRVTDKLLAGKFDKFLHQGIIPITEKHMREPKNN